MVHAVEVGRVRQGEVRVAEDYSDIVVHLWDDVSEAKYMIGRLGNGTLNPERKGSQRIKSVRTLIVFYKLSWYR